MGNFMVKNLDTANLNRKLYYLDGGAEDLPTITNKSTIMPGSECHSLTTMDKWVLNTHYQWIQVREPLQERLAELEERFFTHFGSLISEIRAQGEANKNAIDSLTAEVRTQGISNKTGLDAIDAEIQTQGIANSTAITALNTMLNTRLNTIIDDIDNIEPLITTTNTRLQTIIDDVDGVEGTLTTINNNVAAIDGDTSAMRTSTSNLDTDLGQGSSTGSQTVIGLLKQIVAK